MIVDQWLCKIDLNDRKSAVQRVQQDVVQFVWSHDGEQLVMAKADKSKNKLESYYLKRANMDELTLLSSVQIGSAFPLELLDFSYDDSKIYCRSISEPSMPRTRLLEPGSRIIYEYPLPK
jgi:hypothetical protein